MFNIVHTLAHVLAHFNQGMDANVRTVTTPELALETTPWSTLYTMHVIVYVHASYDERPRLHTRNSVQIFKPTLESTELADRNRKPPFAFNLSMIICVLQFANCLGFYPGLHRPTSRVIRCHGSPKFCFERTEGAGPLCVQ